MAIIDEFTVNVLVNDQPCQEYYRGPERSRGPKKIARYIEAISNAQYKISVRVSPSFEFTTRGIAFKISIDGHVVVQRVFLETCSGRIRDTISQLTVGDEGKSFSFSEIKQTEGEDPLAADIPDDSLKSLGIILVEVYRIYVPKQTPVRKQPLPTEYFKGLQAQRKIPARQLKELELTSLTHSTRLVGGGSNDGWVCLSGSKADTSPLVAFKFKYCSRRMLGRLGFVPFPLPFRSLECRLQKPSREEALTVAKFQKLNNYETHDVPIKVEPGTTVAGKRERDARDEEDSEEHTGKPRKRSRATETIDLCGVDDQGDKISSQLPLRPKNPRTGPHRKTGDL